MKNLVNLWLFVIGVVVTSHAQITTNQAISNTPVAPTKTANSSGTKQSIKTLKSNTKLSKTKMKTKTS